MSERSHVTPYTRRSSNLSSTNSNDGATHSKHPLNIHISDQVACTRGAINLYIGEHQRGKIRRPSNLSFLSTTSDLLEMERPSPNVAEWNFDRLADDPHVPQPRVEEVAEDVVTPEPGHVHLAQDTLELHTSSDFPSGGVDQAISPLPATQELPEPTLADTDITSTFSGDTSSHQSLIVEASSSGHSRLAYTKDVFDPVKTDREARLRSKGASEEPNFDPLETEDSINLTYQAQKELLKQNWRTAIEAVHVRGVKKAQIDAEVDAEMIIAGITHQPEGTATATDVADDILAAAETVVLPETVSNGVENGEVSAAAASPLEEVSSSNHAVDHSASPDVEGIIDNWEAEKIPSSHVQPDTEVQSPSAEPPDEHVDPSSPQTTVSAEASTEASDSPAIVREALPPVTTPVPITADAEESSGTAAVPEPPQPVTTSSPSPTSIVPPITTATPVQEVTDEEWHRIQLARAGTIDPNRPADPIRCEFGDTFPDRKWPSDGYMYGRGQEFVDQVTSGRLRIFGYIANVGVQTLGDASSTSEGKRSRATSSRSRTRSKRTQTSAVGNGGIANGSQASHVNSTSHPAEELGKASAVPEIVVSTPDRSISLEGHRAVMPVEPIDHSSQTSNQESNRSTAAESAAAGPRSIPPAACNNGDPIVRDLGNHLPVQISGSPRQSRRASVGDATERASESDSQGVNEALDTAPELEMEDGHSEEMERNRILLNGLKAPSTQEELEMAKQPNGAHQAGDADSVGKGFNLTAPVKHDITHSIEPVNDTSLPSPRAHTPRGSSSASAHDAAKQVSGFGDSDIENVRNAVPEAAREHSEAELEEEVLHARARLARAATSEEFPSGPICPRSADESPMAHNDQGDHAKEPANSQLSDAFIANILDVRGLHGGPKAKTPSERSAVVKAVSDTVDSFSGTADDAPERSTGNGSRRDDMRVSQISGRTPILLGPKQSTPVQLIPDEQTMVKELESSSTREKAAKHHAQPTKSSNQPSTASRKREQTGESDLALGRQIELDEIAEKGNHTGLAEEYYNPAAVPVSPKLPPPAVSDLLLESVNQTEHVISSARHSKTSKQHRSAHASVALPIDVLPVPTPSAPEPERHTLPRNEAPDYYGRSGRRHFPPPPNFEGLGGGAHASHPGLSDMPRMAPVVLPGTHGDGPSRPRRRRHHRSRHHLPRPSSVHIGNMNITINFEPIFEGTVTTNNHGSPSLTSRSHSRHGSPDHSNVEGC